jgi:hypothetical protein
MAISGFEYEMSVRRSPWGKKTKHGLPAPMVEPKRCREQVPRPSNSMAPGASPFHVNTELMVGMDCLEKGNDPTASLPRDKSCQEVARIKDIKGDVVTFFKPLKQNHPAGDLASPEFVRYRWWVDVDMGTVFWHDHAFGATTWPHGGSGVTIVEPFGHLSRSEERQVGVQWSHCRYS